MLYADVFEKKKAENCEGELLCFENGGSASLCVAVPRRDAVHDV